MHIDLHAVPDQSDPGVRGRCGDEQREHELDQEERAITDLLA
jgi:hypothetical protein